MTFSQNIPVKYINREIVLWFSPAAEIATRTTVMERKTFTTQRLR